MPRQIPKGANTGRPGGEKGYALRIEQALGRSLSSAPCGRKLKASHSEQEERFGDGNGA